MATLLDGIQVSSLIKQKVKKEIGVLSRYGVKPGLGLLLAGEDSSSKLYYESTIKVCKQLGITPYQYELPGNSHMGELINVVHTVNNDNRVNGLLVLFPLPDQLDARTIVNTIVPTKDVDGLGSISAGKLATDESTFQLFRRGEYDKIQIRGTGPSRMGFLPCTPFGVIRLLEHYNVEMKGKHAVVIGKSIAVGKPLSLMLLAKGATVTVCHKDTVDLGYFTRQADILCSATGVAGLVNGDMVKDGVVAVDIGINVTEQNQVRGDLDYNSVEKKASYITPVPGGVGPVTIGILLENTTISSQTSFSVPYL